MCRAGPSTTPVPEACGLAVERGLLVELPEACGLCQQQLREHRGMFVEQLEEGRAVDGDALDHRVSGYRRRAGLTVDERHLADRIASSDRGERPTTPDHLRGPRGDDDHVLTHVQFLEDHLVGLVVDVEASARAELLELQARTDPLTGIANRRRAD